MTLFSGCSGQGAYISFLPPLQAAPTFTWPPTSDSTQLPYVRPAAPLPLDAPKGCIFCAEWGKDRRGDEDSNLSKKVRSFKRLATGMVHGMRSLGSAALDVAYVATGALDIFWECGAWEWDVAAGPSLSHGTERVSPLLADVLRTDARRSHPGRSRRPGRLSQPSSRRRPRRR